MVSPSWSSVGSFGIGESFPDDNRERRFGLDEDAVEPKCARKESMAVRIGFLDRSRAVSETLKGGVSALDFPFVSSIGSTADRVRSGSSVALDLPFRSGGWMREAGGSGTVARASSKGDDDPLAVG